jgi:hypothetical protein
MHPAVQSTTTQAAALSEKNLPIKTMLIVDIAIDSGMLQKRRSTRERCLNPFRFVSHAARYPVQTVTGRKAGIATNVVTISSIMMFDWIIEASPTLFVRPLHKLKGPTVRILRKDLHGTGGR